MMTRKTKRSKKSEASKEETKEATNARNNKDSNDGDHEEEEDVDTLDKPPSTSSIPNAKDEPGQSTKDASSSQSEETSLLKDMPAQESNTVSTEGSPPSDNAFTGINESDTKANESVKSLESTTQSDNHSSDDETVKPTQYPSNEQEVIDDCDGGDHAAQSNHTKSAKQDDSPLEPDVEQSPKKDVSPSAESSDDFKDQIKTESSACDIEDPTKPDGEPSSKHAMPGANVDQIEEIQPIGQKVDQNNRESREEGSKSDTSENAKEQDHTKEKQAESSAKIESKVTDSLSPDTQSSGLPTVDPSVEIDLDQSSEATSSTLDHVKDEKKMQSDKEVRVRTPEQESTEKKSSKAPTHLEHANKGTNDSTCLSDSKDEVSEVEKEKSNCPSDKGNEPEVKLEISSSNSLADEDSNERDTNMENESPTILSVMDGSKISATELGVASHKDLGGNHEAKEEVSVPQTSTSLEEDSIVLETNALMEQGKDQSIDETQQSQNENKAVKDSDVTMSDNESINQGHENTQTSPSEENDKKESSTTLANLEVMDDHVEQSKDEQSNDIKEKPMNQIANENQPLVPPDSSNLEGKVISDVLNGTKVKMDDSKEGTNSMEVAPPANNEVDKLNECLNMMPLKSKNENSGDEKTNVQPPNQSTSSGIDVEKQNHDSNLEDLKDKTSETDVKVEESIESKSEEKRISPMSIQEEIDTGKPIVNDSTSVKDDEALNENENSLSMNIDVNDQGESPKKDKNNVDTSTDDVLSEVSNILQGNYQIDAKMDDNIDRTEHSLKNEIEVKTSNAVDTLSTSLSSTKERNQDILLQTDQQHPTEICKEGSVVHKEDNSEKDKSLPAKKDCMKEEIKDNAENLTVDKSNILPLHHSESKDIKKVEEKIVPKIDGISNDDHLQSLGTDSHGKSVSDSKGKVVTENDESSKEPVDDMHDAQDVLSEKALDELKNGITTTISKGDSDKSEQTTRKNPPENNSDNFVLNSKSDGRLENKKSDVTKHEQKCDETPIDNATQSNEVVKSSIVVVSPEDLESSTPEEINKEHGNEQVAQQDLPIVTPCLISDRNEGEEEGMKISRAISCSNESSFQNSMLPTKPICNDLPINEKSYIAEKMKERSSPELSDLDQIKTKLYLEFSNVHRRKGPERLFSIYWEKMGRYLSYSFTPKPSFWSTDRSTDGYEGGMENFFKKFLSTRSLRKIHNKLMLAIMRNSMQLTISKSKFRRHTPNKWISKVTKKRKLNRPEDKKSELHHPNDCLRITSNETSIELDMDSILMENLDIQFGVNSDVWTNLSGTYSTVQNDSLAPSETKITPKSSDHSKIVDTHDIMSATLPGALSIDPSVKQAVTSSGMTISKEALRYIVVAVREHTSSVLREIISDVEKRDMMNNDNDTKSPGIPVSTNRRSAITNQDIKELLGKKPQLGGGSVNSSLSRLGWERCSRLSNSKSVPILSNHLKHLNMSITDEILSKSQIYQELKSTELKLAAEKSILLNENAMIDSSSEVSVTTKPEAPGKSTTSRINEDNNADTQEKKSGESNERPHTPRGKGRGKDLMALMARKTQGTKETATKNDQKSETSDQKEGDDKNNSENKSTESEPQEPRQHAGGRGFGRKDLNSLRKRSLQTEKSPSDAEKNNTGNDANGQSHQIAQQMMNNIPPAQASPALSQSPVNNEIDSKSQTKRRRQLRRNAMIPKYGNAPQYPLPLNQPNQFQGNPFALYQNFTQTNQSGFAQAHLNQLNPGPRSLSVMQSLQDVGNMPHQNQNGGQGMPGNESMRLRLAEQQRGYPGGPIHDVSALNMPHVSHLQNGNQGNILMQPQSFPTGPNPPHGPPTVPNPRP